MVGTTQPQKVFARAEGSRVISDHDLWRTAQLLVIRHGDDAPIVAAQRADELFEQGDLDCAVVWRSILRAVEELQRVKPKLGEKVN